MRLEVLVAQNNLKTRTFAYESGDFSVQIGSVVKVPLRSRSCFGVVTSLDSSYRGNCREVERTYDGLISDDCLEFLKAVADHYQVSENEVCKLMLFRDVLHGVEYLLEGKRYKVKKPMSLEPSQKQVRGEIISCLGKNKEFFLSGEMGSGKTEVLLSVIGDVMKDGGQVLILMPEVSLTGQWSDRFQGIFGTKPNIWSSRQRVKLRREIWYKALRGEDLIVVGPRSALFLPFRNLRLVIVEEEHDKSFKEEVGIFYNGRDVAILRARAAECPVVLSSATPSMETFRKVDLGHYKPLSLDSRKKVPSKVEFVDMCSTQSKSRISRELKEQIGKNLERGEQVMLFINKKGYSCLILCPGCGQTLSCRSCRVNLIYYNSLKQVRCYYCNYKKSFAKGDLCSTCAKPFIMAYPGLEKVLEECEKEFPHARIASISGDLKMDEVQDVVTEMTEGRIDILVGTQIIAKGYHFPKLTLMGVIDGDSGLRGGELRSGEDMFQLLMQLCGRVGREALPGRVIIQTYKVQDVFMKQLEKWDYHGWAKDEMAAREKLSMPPFSRLVSIIFTSYVEDQARNCAERFYEDLKKKGFEKNLFGWAPAVAYVVNRRYRYRLLIRFEVDEDISSCIKCLKAIKSGSVKVDVDVDPYYVIS